MSKNWLRNSILAVFITVTAVTLWWVIPEEASPDSGPQPNPDDIAVDAQATEHQQSPVERPAPDTAPDPEQDSVTPVGQLTSIEQFTPGSFSTVAGEYGSDTHYKLMNQMVDLLRAAPQGAAELGRLMREHWDREEYAVSAAAVLAAVRTPESHAALGEVLDFLTTLSDQPAAMNLLEQTVRSIQTSGDIAGENTDRLLSLCLNPQLTPEVRQVALLAAGTAGALTQDPAQREKIGQFLAGEYQEAQSQGRRSEALAAIGNMGYEGHFELVRKVSRSPDPQVAARGLDAMRFMKHAEAESELIRFAVADDQLLRATALQTLSWRRITEESVGQLVAVFHKSESNSTDADRDFRVQIINTLANAANPRSQAATAFLEGLVKNPATAEREMAAAKEAIDSLRGN